MTSRTDIAGAITRLLETAMAEPGTYPALAGLKKVEASRYVQLHARAEIFPAALVYVESERIGSPANAPGPKDREASLTIELRGYGEQSETQIDQLAQEIETLIDRNLTLPGDIASAAILERVEFAGADGGDCIFHFATMTYRVEYMSETEGWEDDWNT